MEVNRPLICRLCLKICPDDFEFIEDTLKETLMSLLPNVDLNINHDPVICSGCSDNLEMCFNFKMNSLYKRESTGVHPDDEELKSLTENVEHASRTISSSRRCCFCVEVIKSESFIIFNNVGSNLTAFLEKHFLELVINLNKDSIICMSCYESLQKQVTFITACLSVEENIKQYREVEGTNSKGQIELSRVSAFFPKKILQSDILDSVKIEEGSESTGEFKIKAEPSNDILQSNLQTDLNLVKIEDDYDGEMESEDDLTVKPEDFMEVEEPEMICIKNDDSAVKLEQDDNSNGFHNDVSPKRPSLTKTPMNDNEVTKTKLYKCEICTYQTKNKYNLQRHRIGHQNYFEGTMYECDVCTFKTKYGSTIRRHKLTHKSPSQKSTYKCEKCAYKASRKDYLRNHMLVHRNVSEISMRKCDVCPFQTKHKSSLFLHMSIHKDTVAICAKCGYKASRKDYLRSHMLIHRNASEVTMHKCKLCSFQSKHKRSLELHDLLHKSGKELVMYKCDKCDFQTKYKHYLPMHMRSHKSCEEVPTYKCDVCAFQSKNKQTVKKHALLHKDISEVEVYKCEKCNFQTRYKKNILAHVNNRHRVQQGRN